MIMGPTLFLPSNFVSKNLRLKEILGPKKLLVQKVVGLKEIWFRKFLVQKRSRLKEKNV